MNRWVQAIEENDISRSKINTFVKIDKYIEIINNYRPSYIQELTDKENNSFHVLTYSFSPNDFFGPFKVKYLRKNLVESLFHIVWQIDGDTVIPLILSLTSNEDVDRSILVNHLEPLSNDHLKCTLRLYLLPDSQLIKRASFEIDGKLLESKLPISIRIDEIFGDFNAEFDIPQIESN